MQIKTKMKSADTPKLKRKLNDETIAPEKERKINAMLLT